MVKIDVIFFIKQNLCSTFSIMYRYNILKYENNQPCTDIKIIFKLQQRNFTILNASDKRTRVLDDRLVKSDG